MRARSAEITLLVSSGNDGFDDLEAYLAGTDSLDSGAYPGAVPGVNLFLLMVVFLVVGTSYLQYSKKMALQDRYLRHCQWSEAISYYSRHGNAAHYFIKRDGLEENNSGFSGMFSPVWSCRCEL
ncbi:MAG: hypothetical protein SWH61_07720 [Thermodesulfobacteriota bacterium]|nr:hypothetical protein [Thermodesulfobacteriota bacterium]